MRHGGIPTGRGRARGARIAPVVAVAAGVLLAQGAALRPASASAAERLVVLGAGFGHGVGLSQYGARGMAERGFSHARILAHYYRGTRLQRHAAADRNVRVALQYGGGETTVSGAKSIGGLTTKTTRSYRVVRTDDGLDIRQVGRRKKVGTARTGVEVVPGDATLLRVAGRSADGVQDGSYRGTIEVLPDGGDVLVVNELHLEDYLRGVVTAESPASWPAQALQAQAVVARSYAITNAVGGRPFDQWPDTRSQVYRGVVGESGPGDAAIAATRGRVVTKDGTPVITYFFSTSGGRTEASQNVFGGEPRSWLTSVRDPYEAGAGSPLYRWTRTFSSRQADARVRRFGVGALRRVEVLERGDSPRVVRARIVGDAGSRVVDGGQLQRAFALPERWASFATVSMSGCLTAGPTRAERRAEQALRASIAARRAQRRRAADPRSATAAHGLGVSVRFTLGEDRGTTTAPGAPTPGDAPNASGAPGTKRTTSDGASSAAPDGPADAAVDVATRGAREIAALIGDETAVDDARALRALIASRPPRCRLVGGVRPAPDGAAGRLQRRDGDRWSTIRRVRLTDGRFETTVPRSGRWRVKVGRFATPTASL